MCNLLGGNLNWFTFSVTLQNEFSYAQMIPHCTCNFCICGLNTNGVTIQMKPAGRNFAQHYLNIRILQNSYFFKNIFPFAIIRSKGRGPEKNSLLTPQQKVYYVSHRISTQLGKAPVVLTLPRLFLHPVIPSRQDASKSEAKEVSNREKHRYVWINLVLTITSGQ